MLIMLTVLAILVFSFDIVWTFVIPVARVALSVSTIVELASDWDDHDPNTGWCETRLLALLDKEQHLGPLAMHPVSASPLGSQVTPFRPFRTR